MRKSIVWFTAFLFFTPFLLAADYLAQAEVKIPLGKEEKVSEKAYSDPGVPIEVQVGEQFYVSLESNPSTGYQWELRPLVDKEIVDFLGAGYELPSELALGAPGDQVFTFQVMGPGQTQLSFNYIRPWEPDSSGKTMTFTVMAEPAS